MKNIAKLAVIGALVAFGAAQANAQSNVSQNVVIGLGGFKAGGPVKVLTKDVVAALGGVKGAKLVLVTTPGSSDTNSETTTTFLIRKKGTEDIDVTAAFSRETVFGPVTNKKADYSIDHFTFSSGAADTNAAAALEFDLQGYTVAKTKTVKKKTFSQDVETFDSTVNGSATIAGDLAIVRGKVKVSGGTVQ